MGKSNLKKTKVAIVTGASSGIGSATSRLLAENGYSVVLAARRQRALTALSKTIGRKDVLIRPTDVRVADDVKQLVLDTFARFRRIDALVNCAGVLVGGPVENVSEADLRSMLDTNLLGTILCCKFVLHVMKGQKSGHIVNISSVAGTRGMANMAAYCASKFGVTGFTESLAAELKGTGVKITAIRPGTVVTDLWSWTPELRKKAESAYLQPSDIAGAVLFALGQPQRAVVRDILVHPVT